MDTFATRLRAAMEARGMTAPDLIRATGLSRATVYFMLDGTTGAPNMRAPSGPSAWEASVPGTMLGDLALELCADLVKPRA